MIDAVIFDKDGTLFDFKSSWGAWTAQTVEGLVADPQGRNDLFRLLGYDRVSGDFAPDSIVIGHTTFEIAREVHPFVPGMSLEALGAHLAQLAVDAPLVPAVDLPLVLGDLRQRGLRLGLATNDTEAPARAHLHRAGVSQMFEFVAGCDSGWGGKPAPGQLLAFVAQLGLEPSRVAMVGDSLHDLHAGKAAGMKRVGVLTGIANRAALTPHADVVLQDIGALAAWIDSLSAN